MNRSLFNKLALLGFIISVLVMQPFFSYGEEKDWEPITLEQAIQQAIINDPDLKEMDLDKELYKSANEKMMDMGRKLDVEIEEMVNEQHANPMNPKAKGEIRAELYEMKYQGEKLLHSLEMMDQKKEFKKLEIKLETETAYFDYLNAKHQLDVVQQAYENAKNRLDMARRSMEAGVESKYSLLQAESKVKELEIQLEQAKTNLSLNAMAFNSRIGNSLSEPVNVVEFEKDLPILTTTLSDLVKTALQKRIDHQILLSDESFAEKISQTYQKYYYNFYDGGEKAKKEKELEAEKAKLEVEKSQKAITLQVSQSYTFYQNALLQMKISKERVARSEEAYKLMEVRYENGLVPLQDLLDARLELTQAQVDETNQIYQVWIAYSRLGNTVGTILY
ncbi:TolC family protein [Thermicanus aegyptius]|uniref:TolC family protein n=1 Tax=Thermicanus aegyptius TaxID=94009 RepID=UPI000409374E|nr:TolC family protein [Thermicanus aegyptius]